MKFLVKSGKHTTKAGTFKKGEVMESSIDLSKRFPQCFQKVADSYAPEPTPEPESDEGVNLEAMTVRQLREFAEKQEPPIDLMEATKKDEIIMLIRSDLETR